MAYSMTAYGKATGSTETKNYIVELKSVNSRFFDCTIKIPTQYGHLEEKIKSYLQSRGISRGKISVYVGIDQTATSENEILLNENYASQYIAALRTLAEKFGLRDDISVMRVASNRDIFSFKSPPEDTEKDWNDILPTIKAATDSFLEMRMSEGENLRRDLCEKTEQVTRLIDFIKEHADDAQEVYRARLEQKLRNTLETLDYPIDTQRILTECALFADKTAIDEEMVRLDSHFLAFKQAINSDEAMGRKLDFIFQEVNREVNTIGSKVSDIALTKTVVEIKTMLEKIREQLQNLE